MKTETRLREVEEQLQAEISTRMQISSSSQHTNERITQLERQVSTAAKQLLLFKAQFVVSCNFRPKHRKPQFCKINEKS